MKKLILSSISQGKGHRLLFGLLLIAVILLLAPTIFIFVCNWLLTGAEIEYSLWNYVATYIILFLFSLGD